MAALPAALVESTLFGHQKGAFSGAVADQAGCCEQAHRGTLFLDEIGEMPIELQAKLLRFLEDHMVRRVGSGQPRPVDVRVVSATHRHLEREISAGRFREDLFYRLNVVPVELPALRERPEDIPLLALHFLQKSSQAHGKRFEQIAPDALAALAGCRWPGNVRQLRHVIERVVILNEGSIVRASMLPAEVRGTARPASGMPVGPVGPVGRIDAAASTPIAAVAAVAAVAASRNVAPAPAAADPGDSAAPMFPVPIFPEVDGGSGSIGAIRPAGEIEPLESLERRALMDALIRCNGNVAMAAVKLGIGQATLYRKIKKFDLNRGGRPGPDASGRIGGVAGLAGADDESDPDTDAEPDAEADAVPA
jgi:DNA-binding NtrC family response regulator